MALFKEKKEGEFPSLNLGLRGGGGLLIIQIPAGGSSVDFWYLFEGRPIVPHSRFINILTGDRQRETCFLGREN